MTIAIVVVHVIAALLLILFILLLAGRGGGVSEMFGGGMQTQGMGFILMDNKIDRIINFISIVCACIII